MPRWGDWPFGSVITVRKWVIRLGLVVFGVLLATGIFFGALRLGVLPGLTADGRARSVDMGLIRFTAGLGDLFIHRQGKIAPPPDPYLVLSEHRLAWDSDGFRVPASAAAPESRFDVVALGDSYTESANVARPWPDVLAAQSGLSVRNLGFRGYGPVEESRVLRDYGVKNQPRLVIVGYFEGNDLSEVVSVRWRDPFVLPNIARAKFTPFDPNQAIWKSDHPGPFQYPIRLMLRGGERPMAFLDDYLAWQNADPETYTQSDNLIALETAFREMRDSVKDIQAAPGTGQASCLLVAYFPDKAHIYLPYVAEADRQAVVSTVETKSLQAPGSLITGGMIVMSTYEQIMARLGNHRDAVQMVAARLGVPFLDLTPAFQAGAERGEVLYYVYDTHWNQAGHDLAGRTIADYLATTPAPCASP
jgi:hypothetical protein